MSNQRRKENVDHIGGKRGGGFLTKRGDDRPCPSEGGRAQFTFLVEGKEGRFASKTGKNRVATSAPLRMMGEKKCSRPLTKRTAARRAKGTSRPGGKKGGEGRKRDIPVVVAKENSTIDSGTGRPSNHFYESKGGEKKKRAECPNSIPLKKEPFNGGKTDFAFTLSEKMKGTGCK